MERIHEFEALEALARLLSSWESGAVDFGSLPSRVAAKRLEGLLSDPGMEEVWRSLFRSSRRPFDEVAAKLLVMELFERADGLPQWQAQTGNLRRKRLDQIAQTAEKLQKLLNETPIRHFSPQTLEAMDLDPRLAEENPEVRLAADSDFEEAIDDLKEQVRFWRNVNPLLRYPAHEDAHRRYFIISVAGYLERNFGPGMHRELAVIARIMLRDEDIDTEVVRKILGPAGRRAGRISKS